MEANYISIWNKEEFTLKYFKKFMPMFDADCGSAGGSSNGAGTGSGLPARLP